MAMTAGQVGALFTRSDGEFRFARWARRPVFAAIGLPREEAGQLAEGVEEVLALLPFPAAPAETDATLILVVCDEWRELRRVDGLQRLIPKLDPLLAKLAETDSNQYRVFHFDEAGAIVACIALLRRDENLGAVGPRALGVNQAVQAVLLWSDRAFMEESPVVPVGETLALRPGYAALITAAYGTTLPVATRERSVAKTLAQRSRAQ
ncbi:MAG: hypothetical protein AAGE18_03935 [Pseudomonadota bacterium]